MSYVFSESSDDMLYFCITKTNGQDKMKPTVLQNKFFSENILNKISRFPNINVAALNV